MPSNSIKVSESEKDEKSSGGGKKLDQSETVNRSLFISLEERLGHRL